MEVGSKLVFVLGIHSRCGTNFVRDLLTLHPEVDPSPISEDYIFAHSENLVVFARSMAASHKRNDQNDVLLHLGSGLEKFLMGSSPQRDNLVVCKTPTTTNAQNIKRLFPAARIVFVVRDPRDVAVSARISFGYGLQAVAERWNLNAHNITDMMKKQDVPCHLVHYEDFLSNKVAVHTINRLLGFVHVSGMQYPWRESVYLPVRGSCDFKKPGEPLDWKQQPAPPGFAPVGRWRRKWTSQVEQDFCASIRENMEKFGYKVGKLL